MVNKLQDNLTATIDQHNTYMMKRKEINDNREKLRSLKQAIRDKTATKEASHASFEETQTYRESNQKWHMGYLIFNVIMLLIIIGVAAYLTIKK